MLPSVSVITTSTNSFSRGYLAYLAAIESWTEVADEVVIVDGGTDDRSYEVLKSWVPKGNYRIHAPIEARWPMGQRWHAGQWTISTNIGLDAVRTDWAVIICSDYVLDPDSAAGLREELDSLRDEPGALYRRFKLDRSGRSYPTPLKGVALNLGYLRRKNRPFGYGMSVRYGQPSDFPIYIDEKSAFLDPATGKKKVVFRGGWIPLKAELSSRCFVYGHYFMTANQLMDKLCSYSWVYETRYAGRPPKSPDTIRRAFQLDGRNLIRSRETESAKPHPKTIKRVIDHHYDPAMLGHDGGQATNAGVLERALRRGVRAVSSAVFSTRGFPAVEKSHTWNREEAAPIDLLGLYRRQDSFLPEYMRLPEESDRASDGDRVIHG